MLRKDNPAIRGELELSYTDQSFWYKRTHQVDSQEWRKIRKEIIERDKSKCRFCSIILSKYIVVDHINGDATDNDYENLGLNCKACDRIRHCGLSSEVNHELTAFSSSLSQVEIVKKTHQFFIKNKRNPEPWEIDKNVGKIEYQPYEIAYKRFNSKSANTIKRLESFKGFFTAKMNFDYLYFSKEYLDLNPLSSSLSSLLNNNQLLAASSQARLTCVIAGPGCGKTRTLISRIIHLVKERGIQGKNILALTFSIRSIKEVKERLSSLKLEDSEMPNVFNIHSFCYWFLRNNLQEEFLIIDNNDQKSLIKKIIKDDLDLASFSDNKYIRNIISKISFIKVSTIRNRDGDYELSRFENQEKEIFILYQSHLKKNKLFDFNDILITTLEILSNDQNVRELHQKKFPHILVDEFQDINKIQWSIIKILSGDENNLFLVGDPNQSIYGFQGSSPELIFSMQGDKQWANFYLNKNYRSTPQIIDIGNKFVSLNKETMIQNFLEPIKKEGDRVPVLLNRGIWDVVNEIIALKQRRGISYKDFAIIYRSNFLSSWIEKELIKKGVPYEILNSFRFIEREEIRDVLAYLKSVIYQDDLSILRIIAMVPAIGLKTVQRVKKEARKFENPSIFNFLKHLFLNLSEEEQEQFDWLKNKQKKILKEFFSKLNSLVNLLEMKYSVASFLQQILDNFDYFNYLRDKDNEENSERILNVKQLKNMIVEWEKENNSFENVKVSSSEFINYITISFSGPNNSLKRDNLIISTVHQVKGLEFKVVFFVNLDEKIIPNERQSFRDEKEEERIFYVGITRAKDLLYLVNNSYFPSKFLKSLLD